jgi:hypothetical protein
MEQQDIIPEISTYHHLFDDEFCEIQYELAEHSFNPIDKFLNLYGKSLFNYNAGYDRRENPNMIVWDIFFKEDVRRFIIFKKQTHTYHLNTTTTHHKQNFSFLDNNIQYPLNSYTFTKYNTGFDIYCIVDTHDYRIPLMITTGTSDDLFM